MLYGRRTAQWVLWTVVALMGALVLTIWSGDALIPKRTSYEKSDVIIVLGTPAQDDGSPSKVMKERVDRAFDLFSMGCATRVLFTGGAVKNDYVEAEVMASYAVEMGMPKSVIFIEPSAKTTIENATRSIEFLRQNQLQSAILVTSPYHARRALLLFTEQAPDLQFTVVASHYPPEFNPLRRVSEILREYINLIWYYLRQ